MGSPHAESPAGSIGERAAFQDLGDDFVRLARSLDGHFKSDGGSIGLLEDISAFCRLDHSSGLLLEHLQLLLVQQLSLRIGKSKALQGIFERFEEYAKKSVSGWPTLSNEEAQERLKYIFSHFSLSFSDRQLTLFRFCTSPRYRASIALHSTLKPEPLSVSMRADLSHLLLDAGTNSTVYPTGARMSNLYLVVSLVVDWVCPYLSSSSLIEWLIVSPSSGGPHPSILHQEGFQVPPRCPGCQRHSLQEWPQVSFRSSHVHSRYVLFSPPFPLSFPLISLLPVALVNSRFEMNNGTVEQFAMPLATNFKDLPSLPKNQQGFALAEPRIAKDLNVVVKVRTTFVFC
jgi:hypothetical protein